MVQSEENVCGGPMIDCSSTREDAPTTIEETVPKCVEDIMYPNSVGLESDKNDAIPRVGRKRTLPVEHSELTNKKKKGDYKNDFICPDSQSENFDNVIPLEINETELKKVTSRKTQEGKRKIKPKDSPKSGKSQSKLKACKSSATESKVKGKKGNKTKLTETMTCNEESAHIRIEIPKSSENGPLIDILSRFAEEMSNLSQSMEKMQVELNDKIECVADKVEQRLTQKFNNTLDKRMNSEIAKSKKDTEKQVQGLKDEINTDLKCLQDQIDEINGSEQGRKLNLCIVNLSQRENENVSEIVSDFIKEGLKLQDVSFKAAVRKQSNNNKPGLIIVTCNSQEDREKILKSKSGLKNILKYERVYINTDQSVHTRVNNSNLKLLLSSLGVSGLKVRGSRLVESSYNSENHESAPSNNRAQRYSASVQGHNNPLHSNNSYASSSTSHYNKSSAYSGSSSCNVYKNRRDSYENSSSYHGDSYHYEGRKNLRYNSQNRRSHDNNDCNSHREDRNRDYRHRQDKHDSNNRNSRNSYYHDRRDRYSYSQSNNMLYNEVILFN